IRDWSVTGVQTCALPIYLAKEAIKDAKTDAEKAKRIVAFAHNYIRPTAVATLPNIHTLLEKKKGDCKCYSLLVVNLCRAVGVPRSEERRVGKEGRSRRGA